MNQDYSGPAFPVNEEAVMRNCTGMSLRDFFAAKAMQAYVSSYPRGEICAADLIARDAYDMADAMLLARQGETA